MRVLAQCDQVTLAGIAGADEDVSRLAAEYDLSGVNTSADYQEALERVDADLAIIAIPTVYHVDAGRRALERGMHVLSEKPLAGTIEEARGIVADKQNHPALHYMVDQNYRWRPHNQTLKQALAQGLIGEIGALHLEFRQPEDLLGYREFLDMPLLQDVSIHHFDLIRFLTGSECESVYAHCFRPQWSRFQGRPATEAVLRMGGGVVVNYNATWAARGRHTSWDGDITITGERGCLTLSADDSVALFENGAASGRVLEPVQMPVTELEYALAMLLRCLAQDETPETSLEDNFGSYAMVCAAEQSVALGRPVEPQRLG